MLFLDCEFNGHNGELISMALVSTDGDYFYKIMPYLKVYNLNPWVQENVIPKLEAIEENTAKDWGSFRNELWAFLDKHKDETIVADSPADFVYLFEQLHYMTEDNKYRYISTEIKTKFVVSGALKPENPHNALSDARALRDWYIKENTMG